jgi:ribokinase
MQGRNIMTNPSKRNRISTPLFSLCTKIFRLLLVKIVLYLSTYSIYGHAAAFMKNSSIVIVGSSNTDMVVLVDHLPAAGETILGGKFFMNPGGKGANQAVAASRLGGAVTFIAKIGNDIFGKRAVALMKNEGIDTSHILEDPDHPSGIALITVDQHGENCIVVASGSNAALNAGDLLEMKEIIQQAGIVLLQLEIPLGTVEYVVQVAAAAKAKLILNPAPARVLSDELLSKLDFITPNETEAEMLTGVEIKDEAGAEKAAKKLKEKGVKTVIITMGARGAFLLHNDECRMIPALAVKAVDTTAAGDVFNGALSVALSESKPVYEAVRYACHAASVSVTRLGAQASAPYKNEIG